MLQAKQAFSLGETLAPLGFLTKHHIIICLLTFGCVGTLLDVIVMPRFCFPHCVVSVFNDTHFQWNDFAVFVRIDFDRVL